MSNAYVYRTPPQMERKAAQELREAGIRAYVPMDPTGKRRKATAPGYVFSERAYHTAFAKHVRGKIGTVPRGQLSSLYLRKPKRRADEANPYTIGQTVYRGEVPAKVVAISGRTCLIATTMLGKAHTVAIHYTQLRPG